MALLQRIPFSAWALSKNAATPPNPGYHHSLSIRTVCLLKDQSFYWQTSAPCRNARQKPLTKPSPLLAKMPSRPTLVGRHNHQAPAMKHADGHLLLDVHANHIGIATVSCAAEFLQ